LITADVIADLTSFFAQWRLPPLEFAGICAFANTLYLLPEPQRSIGEIIEGLAERYPDTPPYGGAIPVGQIVPHVTVAYSEDPVLLLSISEAFCRASIGQLPVRARVREAVLLAQEDRIFRTMAVLPFRV
jgi:hypothetical protein